MQKKLIALAVAGLASSAAFAQSNVTVYGVVDAGYAYVHAAGSKNTNAIVSGGLAGSRLGFKGVEDLGNGLKALFTLEYALAVDSNTGLTDAASNQARQQMVGVTGNFGTAVAGYLQTAGYDFACAANPLAGSALDGYNMIGGGATLLNCGAKGRAQNAVAYISPNFSGLTVAVNHARVTEQAFTGTKDIYANLIAATYDNGPISAGLVYSKINGNGAGLSVSNDSVQAGVVTTTASTILANDVTEWGIRGSYDFKVAKVLASWQQENIQNVDGKNSKWQISGVIPTTATGAAIVMFAKNKMGENTTSNDSSKAWSLAYTHGLSKRSTLYAGYTRVSNDSNAKVGTFGVYGPYNDTPFNGKTSIVPENGGSASIFAMGLNHKF